MGIPVQTPPGSVHPTLSVRLIGIFTRTASCNTSLLNKVDQSFKWGKIRHFAQSRNWYYFRRVQIFCKTTESTSVAAESLRFRTWLRAFMNPRTPIVRKGYHSRSGWLWTLFDRSRLQVEVLISLRDHRTNMQGHTPSFFVPFYADTHWWVDEWAYDGARQRRSPYLPSWSYELKKQVSIMN